MRRILILSASYGEGHNSAARALRQAFAEIPDVEAEIVDVFAQHAPRLDRISRRAYIGLINRAPSVWSGVYGWLDRSPRAPWVLRALSGQRRLLARILAEKRPDALCCTYPVYPWLLAQLRQSGVPVPPIYTVVTDAITINSLWYRAPSAAWFVTDTDSAEFLRQRGLPSEKVHVSGFPVSLSFADRPAQTEPPDPAFSRQRRILYMINSGRAQALETAASLLLWSNWHVTFTAGRDEQLKQQLEAMVRQSPASAEVLGWTDRIPELLMTHHLVISKAGGATTQESINALCPMLVNQIVPGQEEGNWELLRRREAGALALTPRALGQLIPNAFADDAKIWRKWRNSLRQLARPNAARDIATAVLERCATAAKTEPLAIG